MECAIATASLTGFLLIKLVIVAAAKVSPAPRIFTPFKTSSTFVENVSCP